MGLLSISISVLSIVLGSIVWLRYGFGTEGSYLLLAVLGAPTTFLTYLLSGYRGELPIPYLFTCFLYFLQYQLIAVAVHKFGKKIHPGIFVLGAVVLIGGIALMYYLLFGRHADY
jgi:hypothetical protein